ncbi:hypothetical protein CHS0354_015736 [Potamilus streckersoni]|uniref:Fibronectin type-III domain-containing protein n=1 Tax=Potamilus streckersoni TaxID=2493646 RepID=A0AAE0W7G9_9BIVA|nr:hypothetical protein CHS0354_015736 [Potamilus streckersoni]
MSPTMRSPVPEQVPDEGNTKKLEEYSKMKTIRRNHLCANVTFIICAIIYAEAQSDCTSPAIKCGCEQRNNKFIINCRDKKLTKIPVFNNTSIQYEELTFSSSYPNTSKCSVCNRITFIPPRAFVNLNVKRIDLTRNALTYISNDSFAGVEPYLKELLLEGNEAKEPNYAALKNLTGLTTLHLENFQQTTLYSNNIFGYLQNLEYLKLKTFKKLSFIDSAAFQNKVPKLKTLWLEDLPLVTYPAGAVLNIPSLQTLHFINTPVYKLYSMSFKDLHSLKVLDLSHNKIDSIENDTFTGITDTLLFLNLAVNRIGYNINIRESLNFLTSQNWTNLEQLSLDYNKLDTFLEGPFRTMSNLRYLTLESCQLSSISSRLLQGLQNLHTLDLSQNRISDISVNAFVHTPQLKDLRLYEQNHKFSKDLAINFPPAAVKIVRTSLTHLNIEQNLVNVSEIWEIIELLTNLEELKLRSTNLVTVPDFVFRYHTQLQVLDLSENQITSFDQKSFHGLKDNLTSLSLANNNLTTIDECVFKNFSKLNYLYLTGNMWTCNCHLLWLYDWITNKMSAEPGTEYIMECVCHSPPKLSEKYIQAVNRSDLSCIPVYIPYTCPDYYITTITTTTSTTTPKSTPIFKIFITEVMIFSINVFWTIDDKSDVTGYVLNIYDLQNTSRKSLTNLHRDNTRFKFKGLQPQRTYNICLQVELNNILNQNLISCVTQSTKSVPAFELFKKTISDTYIEVRWKVSDMTEITGFLLSIVPLKNATDKHYETIPRDGSSFLFRNLKSFASYKICLELIIKGQVYDKEEKCITLQTKKTNKTVRQRTAA